MKMRVKMGRVRITIATGKRTDKPTPAATTEPLKYDLHSTTGGNVETSGPFVPYEHDQRGFIPFGFSPPR